MTDLHVTHHVKGLKLGPKLGPFPVVVWVLIIGAGLYVAHRRSLSSSASSTDTTSSTDTSTTTTSDVPAGASSDVPLEVVGGGGQPAGGGTNSSSGPVTIADNVTWQSAAISALIKAGITPITANNAVDKYLSGDVLTTDEAHAVNVALGLVGPPPEGAPPVTVITPPAKSGTAPRPTTAPVPRAPAASTKHTAPSKHAPRPSRGGRYTVKSGDTLYAIAASHHVGEPALYQLNRSTIEAAARRHGRSSSESGHWIFPGTVLALP